MKIKDLGEFGLIARIQRALPAPGKEVLVGIGDDVAVLQSSCDRVLLATCDVQMEGTHFLRRSISPRELGHKSLSINLSDIAASGGVPKSALISLGLPDDLDVEFVDELYGGLRQEAERHHVNIVGGNISRSPLGLFIDIFLMGDTPRENLLLRSGAHAGDQILVTGSLGDAAAGVALLLDPKLGTTDAYAASARTRFRLPTPRVREGITVASMHAATAMLDVSDGFASDLGHICESSRVGARVYAEKLPVAADNRALARSIHGNEFHFALFGGEDYELLFTAPVETAGNIVKRIAGETGTPVHIVGEILPENAGRELVMPNRQVVPLEAKGWDHFRP